MEEGKIYEIVWDNGCFSCSSSYCVKNLISKNVFDQSTTQSYENCKEVEEKDEQNGNKNLEPKFYITWFGTDKNKRQLKTAGLAMRKFKPYISTNSFYSRIKGLF